MIKVLHIIIGLNIGGAEMMLKRLVRAHLNDNKFTHAVISLTTVGDVGESLKTSGINVHALGMQSFMDIFGIFAKLIIIIRAENPQIVQTWMYHADLLGGLASIFAGCRRVIWGIRTTEVSTGVSRATRFIRRLCSWLSWFLPVRIVCAAHASLNSHIAIGYDPSRMVVIQNGVDKKFPILTCKDRAIYREMFGFDSTELVIGCVGRFNPDKDFYNFVQAAGLVAQNNEKIRFLMVGRGLESDNNELLGWIAETGKANIFKLLGERTDIPECLNAMDIFCLSSRTEGFPNVVAEAMATGLPCVVTDVGDAAMLLGGAGLVVRKENPYALADGLTHILAMSAESRQQMGQRGKDRILAEFTIEHSRQRFENLYSDLIKKDFH